MMVNEKITERDWDEFALHLVFCFAMAYISASFLSYTPQFFVFAFSIYIFFGLILQDFVWLLTPLFKSQEKFDRIKNYFHNVAAFIIFLNSLAFVFTTSFWFNPHITLAGLSHIVIDAIYKRNE